MRGELISKIGIWGQRHYNYLKKHSPTVINTMRIKGTLEQYLRDIDHDAEEMFSRLAKRFAERDGIIEALKATDQMEWVRRMNAVRTQATEIVNKELIFV